MSDLVGNPEDQFPCIVAYTNCVLGHVGIKNLFIYMYLYNVKINYMSVDGNSIK